MNDMTCREFENVVHGFVRMELLDVTVRESALDHSARCGNCAGTSDGSHRSCGGNADAASQQHARTCIRLLMCET